MRNSINLVLFVICSVFNTHCFGAVLFYTGDYGTLNVINTDGTNARTIWRADQGVHEGAKHIFVDTNAKKVYWSAITSYTFPDPGGVIYRSNYDGSAVERVLSDLRNPTGLYVFEDKIYWATVWGAKIQKANLDGTGIEDLVIGVYPPSGVSPPSPEQSPFGLKIDEINRKLYWSDQGDPQGIDRSNLDGSAITNALIPIYGQSLDLALDVANDRIYWTESHNRRILSAKLDGSSQTTLLSDLTNPSGIALDAVNGQLYWSEWWSATRRIFRMNTDGTGLQAIHTHDAAIWDVEFVRDYHVGGSVVPEPASLLLWAAIGLSAFIRRK